jgi:hypothetical protein
MPSTNDSIGRSCVPREGAQTIWVELVYAADHARAGSSVAAMSR